MMEMTLVNLLRLIKNEDIYSKQYINLSVMDSVYILGTAFVRKNKRKKY